jgi:hypothetical protein
MGPSERLARIKAIQDDAATQREAERNRIREPISDRLQHRVNYLRQRELRGWLMIEAEINELRRLESELELDREQRLNDDWTRR